MLTFDLKQTNFQSDFDSNQTTTLTVTSEAIQGYSFTMKKLYWENIFLFI
jgi:hypothetical protein